VASQPALSLSKGRDIRGAHRHIRAQAAGRHKHSNRKSIDYLFFVTKNINDPLF
jgi:hypothetical protein